MQLVQLDVEGTHRGQDDLGDHAGPVGIEESVEHATHPIIVECLCVVAAVEAQQRRVEWGRPLAERIDRAMIDDQVADHDPDHRRRSQS